MAVILEKLYEVALNKYHMKLLAGGKGLDRLVDWVHMMEEPDYTGFLRGRELLITTGIKRLDDKELLEFTEKLYESQISGLVLNVGKYITKVPPGILEFGESHNFPIFTLPWEVHLVDFIQDLCNLIYQSMWEYSSLDDAVQHAIFHSEEKERYLEVFAREGIHRRTPVRLLQCYFPDIEHPEGEETRDVPRFYYHFQRFCQQAVSRLKRKYVVFHKGEYLTIVLFEVTEEEVEQVLREMAQAPVLGEPGERLCVGVSGADTGIRNLEEKYRNMSVVCRRNAISGEQICREEELGVWNLLLAIPGREKLREYEAQMLGDLKRMDEETGSNYCMMLESYLRHNGNVQEVAADCFLHRNTVTYQLKRIAEILNVDLSLADDRNKLYLAFEIRKILAL